MPGRGGELNGRVRASARERAVASERTRMRGLQWTGHETVNAVNDLNACVHKTADRQTRLVNCDRSRSHKYTVACVAQR